MLTLLTLRPGAYATINLYTHERYVSIRHIANCPVYPGKNTVYFPTTYTERNLMYFRHFRKLDLYQTLTNFWRDDILIHESGSLKDSLKIGTIKLP